MKKKILCAGEILWDSMPPGLFLGGAPYNAGYHLNKLGLDVYIISRVGDDDLGREAVKRAEASGVYTDLIQVDPDLSTGFVEVNLGADGIPEYNIKKPVAWDEISLNPELAGVAESADALIFGTLAQRSETSRNTIRQLGKTDRLKVLDLNFRFPYVDPDITDQSLQMADVVKMNHEELEQLQKWFSLSGEMKEAIRQVSDRFSLEMVCVTSGAVGALLWDGSRFYEGKSYKVNVADTVGSGDAFLAVLVSGYLKGVPPEKLIRYSNRMGAFIATQNGGTPDYRLGSIEEIDSLPLSVSPPSS